MLLSLPKINLKPFITNLLFLLIPISFILGNLILNLNVLLIIIFAIIFYQTNVFKINLNYLDKTIILFFLFTIITGVLNTFLFKNLEELSGDYIVIIKTIAYLRFLLFYFVIRFLISKNIINFKFFFIVCSLCAYFVCLDLVYQYNFGKDIFGYVSIDPRRLSGPFGDYEPVAGSYLQRFSVFSFFLIFLFYDKKKYYLFLFLLVTFILVFFSLIISGNRMPLILFLALFVIIFTFTQSMRKYLIFFILVASIIFTVTYNMNANLKTHFNDFNNRITNEFVEFFQAVTIKDKKSNITHEDYTIVVDGKKIQMPNVYIKEFNSGYQTWLQNKYIGGGLRSFKENCKVVVLNCNTHPHNYYLEILSDLGLVGFALLILIFGMVIYESIGKNIIRRSKLEYNNIMTPFMFLFLIEVFPIRTTGSFFTTGNATYIFLIMAITVALSRSPERKI
jgi:O-antigen ligase